jgi:amino acid permease
MIAVTETKWIIVLLVLLVLIGAWVLHTVLCIVEHLEELKKDAWEVKELLRDLRKMG